MNTLFKIILISSPILALIFYYTVMKQSEIDTQIKHEDTLFERDFNEFSADFEEDPDVRKKFRERAGQAEEEIEGIEDDIKESEGKSREFEVEFRKGMEEFEKMQSEKGGTNDIDK